MRNPAPHDAAAVINGLRELMDRHAAFWCDPSRVVEVLCFAAIESGDYLPLIRRAINGCKYAHRALCLQAAKQFSADEKPPEDLKTYAIGALMERYPGKGAKGEDGARDIGRNCFIAYLVEHTSRLGFPHTRNRSKHETAADPSACYLVSQAGGGAKVEGLKMPGERRVQRIFEANRGDCGMVEGIVRAFEAHELRKDVPRSFT